MTITIHHDLHQARLEIARLREALGAVVAWAEDLRLFSDHGTVLAPVFVKARAALIPPASSPRLAPAPGVPSAGRQEPGAAAADSRGPDRA